MQGEIPYPEFRIILDDKEIRCPAYPEECDYVRITDLEGNEVVYWHFNEWQEEPQLVMGAILAVIGNPIEHAVNIAVVDGKKEVIALTMDDLNADTVETIHKTLASVFSEED